MAAARKPTLFAVDLQENLALQQSKKPKSSGRGRAPKNLRPQKFTVAEAFSVFTTIKSEGGINSDIERGLRSIAFLLHSLSEIGNRDVEGFVAHGLADAIEHYADRVDALATRKGEI